MKTALQIDGTQLRSELCRLTPEPPMAPTRVQRPSPQTAYRKARKRAALLAILQVQLADAAGQPFTEDDLRVIAAGLRRSADGLAAIPGSLSEMHRRRQKARFIYGRARDYDIAARVIDNATTKDPS